MFFFIFRVVCQILLPNRVLTIGTRPVTASSSRVDLFSRSIYFRPAGCPGIGRGPKPTKPKPRKSQTLIFCENMHMFFNTHCRPYHATIRINGFGFHDPENCKSLYQVCKQWEPKTFDGSHMVLMIGQKHCDFLPSVEHKRNLYFFVFFLQIFM